MHRTTLAFAVAGLSTIKFGHHAVQIGTLRDAMSVTAMRRDDAVPIIERTADTDCDGFLANVAMHDPEYFPGVVIGRGALLKAPDNQHATQHFALLVGRQVCRDSRHGVPLLVDGRNRAAIAVGSALPRSLLPWGARSLPVPLRAQPQRSYRLTLLPMCRGQTVVD